MNAAIRRDQGLIGVALTFGFATTLVSKLHGVLFLTKDSSTLG